MPDNISRQHLMKKLLDRWENEGGRIYVDPKSDSPDRRASKDNVALHPKVSRQSVIEAMMKPGLEDLAY